MPVAEKQPADALHKKEKEEFHALLRQTGETLPDGAEDVLDAFLETEGHITPEYLTDKLAEHGRPLALGTVRNALELLCRYGIAQKTLLNGRGPWFEHRHVNGEHDHLLCTGCGRVIEFKGPDCRSIGETALKAYDFEPIHHRLTVYGLCSNCRKRKETAMPLSMAACGEWVKIVRLIGGREVAGRLQAMGLTVGDTIQVLNKCGPIIVNVKGSRLALGEGFAEKVEVSSLA